MMSTLPTRILISFYAKREPNDGSLFYYIKEQKIQQIRLTRMGEPAMILYMAFNEFRKLIITPKNLQILIIDGRITFLFTLL